VRIAPDQVSFDSVEAVKKIYSQSTFWHWEKRGREADASPSRSRVKLRKG